MDHFLYEDNFRRHLRKVSQFLPLRVFEICQVEIKSTSAHKINFPAFVFFFQLTDVLLYTTPIGGNQFKLNKMLPLLGMQVVRSRSNYTIYSCCSKQVKMLLSAISLTLCAFLLAITYGLFEISRINGVIDKK